MAQRWFVVADGRGRVDWQYTGDGRRILHVLVCRSSPAGYLQRLRDLEVGYFVVGDERVDLREGLRSLGESGIKRVVADSGGTLNASLLRQGLVQYIDVVTLPGLVGGAGAPTMFDGPELTAARHRCGWSSSTSPPTATPSAPATGSAVEPQVSYSSPSQGA